MLTPYHKDDNVTLYHGDCLDVLQALPDCSVDSVTTDPPYALEFLGKEWDTFGYRRQPGDPNFTPGSGPFGRAKVRHGAAGSYGGKHLAAMQAFQAWNTEWATECLRVLKPGGHLLAFGGTRTWHRLAAAIEDAGFEVRDSIAWLYSQGFSKSMDVAKAIAKADPEAAAQQWSGWGTSIKPAHEPIVVARKPLDGTVAANVLAYGTGALNIDATRVEANGERFGGGAKGSSGFVDGYERGAGFVASTQGRLPTNVVLDGATADELDRQVPTAGAKAPASGPTYSGPSKSGSMEGAFAGMGDRAPAFHADSGGASRFFPVFRYQAKAPAHERPKVDGVAHATVKPLALMRWLIRLVAAPGAVVLDPFVGSGTTIEAALLEGVRVVGIEREADYLPLIDARITRAAA